MFVNKVHLLFSALSCLIAIVHSRQDEDFLPSDFLNPCSYGSGWTDPYLGTLALQPELYCSKSDYKHIKGFTCCLPRKPSEKFPILYLFLNGPDPVTRLDWRAKRSPAILARAPRVYFIIHGFPENTNRSSWMRAMAAVFNKFNQVVVGVDASNDETSIFAGMANMRTVGLVLTRILYNWNLLSKSIFIGFSQGAHVIAEIARNIRPRGGLLRNCLAIDPQGVFYDAGPSEIRIKSSDCHLVQVIHANAELKPNTQGLLQLMVTTYWKSGHCDWWLNCGHQTIPCFAPYLNMQLKANGLPMVDAIEGDDPRGAVELLCSHLQAPSVTVAHLNKRCTFLGSPCPNCGLTSNPSACEVDLTAPQVPFLSCSNKQNISYFVAAKAFPHC